MDGLRARRVVVVHRNDSGSRGILGAADSTVGVGGREFNISIRGEEAMQKREALKSSLIEI